MPDIVIFHCDDVSNLQRYDCLLNRLFRRRSKKTSKLRVTGICAGNSPVTGELSAQKTSNAEMFALDNVIMLNDFDVYVIKWYININPGIVPIWGNRLWR